MASPKEISAGEFIGSPINTNNSMNLTHYKRHTNEISNDMINTTDQSINPIAKILKDNLHQNSSNLT